MIMSRICIATIGGSFSIGSDWTLRTESGEIEASQFVAQWQIGEAPERITFPQLVEIEGGSEHEWEKDTTEEKMMVTLRSPWITFIAREPEE